MQNKLQELTDKLYNEGLSKGKEEGEALLAKAKAEAAEIVAAAKKEAAGIISKAENEANDFKTKVAGDVENLVVMKMTAGATEKALSDEAFVKEIIKAVAVKFNAEEAQDLDVILPESLKAGLEPFVKNELASILGGKISASFSKKIAGGFTIGPKDGSYFISLTDETFKELVSEYLRPVTRKLLFGE